MGKKTFRLAIDTSKFEVGNILRFSSVPIHYAVYIGDGEIVHYNKMDGSIGIMREKLEDYLNRTMKGTRISGKVAMISKNVVKVTYKLAGKSKSPAVIRERALRYVGKKDYNPLIRNCEHFATWCVYGKALSGQSRVAAMGTGTTVIVAAGGGVGAFMGFVVGSVFLPGPGNIAGAAVGGAIGAGVGGVVGLISAGAGWASNHFSQKESEEFT